MRKLVYVGSLVFLALAACQSRSDPCANQSGTWPATFLGGAYGKGEVSLVREPSGSFVGTLRLTQTEGRESGDALVLDGRGECRDGVVKLHFGGGRTTDGQLHVLGGTLTAVLARPGFIDAPFGAWEAELTSAAWKDPRRVSGPWVYSPALLAQAPAEALPTP